MLSSRARDEAERVALADKLGADVRCHDDDAVAEIHPPPLGVGQMAVIEYLQQDVEDIRVRLFDFVEQDEAVGLAPHGLGELSALFIADVSGGRAYQARDGEFLHELGHVDADERVLTAEHELGQRSGQLGLADAGRPQEDEVADGVARVFESGAGAPDGLGDGVDGLVLADDALVQDLFHLQQAGGLLLGELDHRDAGPHGHHLGDVLFRDLGLALLLAGLPLGFDAFISSSYLQFALAQFRRIVVLLAGQRRVFVLAQLVPPLCASRRVTGLVRCRILTRDEASSIRSMALSGRKRSGI